jgi:hypothetical protein
MPVCSLSISVVYVPSPNYVPPKVNKFINSYPLFIRTAKIGPIFVVHPKKERKISIFPSDFVQSDPILAVHLNMGLKALIEMQQQTLKNVNNCLNTNIYSYLETSGGQSSNPYLNAVHFFNIQVK